MPRDVVLWMLRASLRVVLKQGGNGGSLMIHQADVRTRFNIEPEQRLRVGAAQIEAPVGEIRAHAIGVVEC